MIAYCAKCRQVGKTTVQARQTAYRFVSDAVNIGWRHAYTDAVPGNQFETITESAGKLNSGGVLHIHT